MLRARSPLYGLLAEFSEPGKLAAAVRRIREAGFQRIEAYTPFPVEEVIEARGLHHSQVPLLVFFGGLFGGLAGFFLQYWVAVIDYPLNIGGRPFNSWPAFIPVTFEGIILIAAFTAVLGMLALNGLPMPYHPVFNVPQFELASRNRFFLLIRSRDGKFELEETRKFLEDMEPLGVYEVER